MGVFTKQHKSYLPHTPKIKIKKAFVVLVGDNDNILNLWRYVSIHIH